MQNNIHNMFFIGVATLAISMFGMGCSCFYPRQTYRIHVEEADESPSAGALVILHDYSYVQPFMFFALYGEVRSLFTGESSNKWLNRKNKHHYSKIAFTDETGIAVLRMRKQIWGLHVVNEDLSATGWTYPHDASWWTDTIVFTTRLDRAMDKDYAGILHSQLRGSLSFPINQRKEVTNFFERVEILLQSLGEDPTNSTLEPEHRN